MQAKHRPLDWSLPSSTEASTQCIENNGAFIVIADTLHHPGPYGKRGTGPSLSSINIHGQVEYVVGDDAEQPITIESRQTGFVKIRQEMVASVNERQ